MNGSKKKFLQLGCFLFDKFEYCLNTISNCHRYAYQRIVTILSLLDIIMLKIVE